MMSSKLIDAALIDQVVAVGASLDAEELNRTVHTLINGDITLDASVLSVVKVTGIRESYAPQFVRLMREWSKRKYSSEALGFALISTHQTRKLSNSSNVKLVWTGPVTIPEIQVKTNLSVLLELIRQAEYEIVIVGYSITDFAKSVFEGLAVARSRGVQVTIIANQIEQFIPVIRRHWTKNAPLPRLYSRLASQEDAMSALHAKLAIIDHRQMLVTSANLTYHGLSGNLEIGVVIEDRIAAQAVKLINQLIENELITPYRGKLFR